MQVSIYHCHHSLHLKQTTHNDVINYPQILFACLLNVSPLCNNHDTTAFLAVLSAVVKA